MFFFAKLSQLNFSSLKIYLNDSRLENGLLYFKKGNERNSYVGITKTFEVNIL